MSDLLSLQLTFGFDVIIFLNFQSILFLMMHQRKIKLISTNLSLLSPLLQNSRFALSCVDVDSDDRMKACKSSKNENNVKFDFDPKSKLGPRRWDEIDVKRSDYFQWIGKSKNQCDGRKQSPIDVEPNDKCKDDHKVLLEHNM